MNNRIKINLVLGLIALSLFVPTIMLAAGGINGMLDEAAGSEGAGYNTKNGEFSFALAAGAVVRTFISLIGIIFICYTIYGGFLWMTAAGNEEKVATAKKIIRDGIIGIIVILASAALYYFVFNALQGAATGGGGTASGTPSGTP